MKSGLEGRNNVNVDKGFKILIQVSMKSGLEGRNNSHQYQGAGQENYVSMKSGLEGRNNQFTVAKGLAGQDSLNEVRPRRPEQSARGKYQPLTL